MQRLKDKQEMWDADPDRVAEKKLYRIGKAAASAIGGGLGVWGLTLFYPHPEGSERITHVLGLIGWVLIIYGTIMLFVIIVNQRIAPKVNKLLVWFVIPACLYYIFVNNWHG